jgi:hypothetical protein
MRERRSLCVLGAAAIVCGLTLVVLAPSTALADEMSLGLSAEAVQNATTQITYTADTEGSGYVTLALNNADVPCGSSPEDDYGTAILEPHGAAAPQTGVFMGSTSFEPTEPGAFIICGWVTGFGGSFNLDAEVFAAASLPIAVRPPHISLALSLPQPVTPGKARACGTEKLDAEIATTTIHASGISCRAAHSVVHAVEFARNVPISPYNTYSRSYSVSTPAGRFACRREPFGLAGSEHSIRCNKGHARVSWSTTEA